MWKAKYEKIEELLVSFEVVSSYDAKLEPFLEDIRARHKIMIKFKKDMTIFMERVRVYLLKVAFC